MSNEFDWDYMRTRLNKEYDWRVDKYSFDADKYGKWLKVDRSGGGHNDDQDAFRHAYTSANIYKENGGIAATASGVYHEDIRGAENYQDPVEAAMDNHNNSIGREIGARAAAEGWDNQKIAIEVKKALDEGKLIRRPGMRPSAPGGTVQDPNNPAGPTHDINPTAIPHTSVLDKAGEVLGSVGRGLLTVGNMAVNTAFSIGQNELEHAFTLAASGQFVPEVKTLLMQNAAKAVFGQMLGAMQQAAQNRPKGAWEELGGVMNKPSNDEMFRDIADMMNGKLTRGEKAMADDLVKMVADFIGAGKFDTGNTYVKFITAPERDPQAGIEGVLEGIMNGHLPPSQRPPREGGYIIHVMGMPWEFETSPLPEGGMTEKPTTGFDPGGGNGAVQVQGYSRGQGQVKSHTRSRPDGEESNNLSYRAPRTF